MKGTGYAYQRIVVDLQLYQNEFTQADVLRYATYLDHKHLDLSLRTVWHNDHWQLQYFTLMGSDRFTIFALDILE